MKNRSKWRESFQSVQELKVKLVFTEVSKLNARLVPTAAEVNKKNKDKSDIRLPKITMKPYDDNPLKWKAFIDTFKITVHKRTDLTNIEKMTYLTSLLEGEAEACVAGITLSN